MNNNGREELAHAALEHLATANTSTTTHASNSLPRLTKGTPNSGAVNSTNPDSGAAYNSHDSTPQHATITIPATSNLHPADVADNEEKGADGAESSGPSPLAHLPPELLDAVLDHVPPEQQQRAALALSRTLGHPVSNAHLWKHLVVRQPKQLLPLYYKLKEEGKTEGGGATHAVKTFAQESWRGDVDILNNLLRWLPSLRTIMLNCGTNFVPEHLQEMFATPRPDIERLEMRFRPYVEQASYYQFLKGSYYDTAVETLRQWPETPSFTHLSLVQDLTPRGTAPPTRNTSEVSLLADDLESLGWQSRFPSRFPSRLGSAAVSAAPSVAHSDVPSATVSAVASTVPSTVGSAATSTVASALASPATSDTEGASDESTPPTSVDDEEYEEKGYPPRGPFPLFGPKMAQFRPKTFAQPIVFFDIKCISRFGASPAARHITHFRLRVPSRDIAAVLISPPERSRLFPSLRYLDISTTNVRLDATLNTLLRHYERLEHLVLDRVNLFGFRARESGPALCKELGIASVSAGLARGKERERQIAAWDTAERTRQAERDAARRRAGLPDPDEEDDDDEQARAQRQAEAEAQAMRDEMARQIALARSRRGHRSAGQAPFSLRNSRRSTASTAVPAADLPPSDRAYFVLPALPTLKSISIGGETPNLSRFKASTWEDEFHMGWRAGLATLHGWAVHVAEKYERAVKKADEFRESQARGKRAQPKGKGKAKAVAPNAKPPPLDIRLYRFATPCEPTPAFDPDDPTVGLVEIPLEETVGRPYLDAYKQAIADAELYTHTQAVRPPCVLCTVPDCEGPLRRGADGERIDGRGGMDRDHRPQCGHEIGRMAWGWEGVEARYAK